MVRTLRGSQSQWSLSSLNPLKAGQWFGPSQDLAERLNLAMVSIPSRRGNGSDSGVTITIDYDRLQAKNNAPPSKMGLAKFYTPRKWG